MAYAPIRTAADLAARVVPGQTREDDYMDFKADPWARNDAGRRECAADVAQFANASGGAILLGAPEQDHVAVGFKDVPEPEELPRWIGDVINRQLEPVPPIEPHVIAVPGGTRVVVVNVPPSPVLIGRKTGEGYEFPIRAGDGKRYMTLMEVEARMRNNERLARLRLEQIRPDRDLVILDAPTRGTSDRGWNVTRVDDHVVSLAMGALHVDVPLAYVEAVYRTPEPGVAWVIALSAQIERVGPSGGSPEHLLVRKMRA